MNRLSIAAMAAAAMLSSGCVGAAVAAGLGANPPELADDNGGLQGRAHRVAAPKTDRCKKVASNIRDLCDRTRQEAALFVSKLSVDDQVCLDGQAMEKPTFHCAVRAFVADVARNSVKLEIRESPPGSKYVPMETYWYAEGALVDRYIQMSGF